MERYLKLVPEMMNGSKGGPANLCKPADLQHGCAGASGGLP